jgi:hypothetical protein
MRRIDEIVPVVVKPKNPETGEPDGTKRLLMLVRDPDS